MADFRPFQIYEKCSRTPNWLNTSKGVKFDLIFHIKKLEISYLTAVINFVE